MMRLIIFILLFFSSLPVWSSEFIASINTQQTALNDVFQLTLSIDENRSGQPDFSPLKENFNILSTSQSMNTHIINGNVSVSKTWTLSLSPKKMGNLTIPAISFGNISSQPLQIEVLDADNITSQNDTGLSITATLMGDKHYVFQEIPLTLRIETTQPFSRAELITPKTDDIEITQRGQDKRSQMVKNGQRITVIEREYTLRPQRTGNFELSSFILRGNFVNKSARTNGFDDFFDSPFTVPGKAFIAKSEPLTLDVKANPNKDGTWFLPAKHVEFLAQWLPEKPKFKVGEPATLQLSLIAVGARPEQLPKLNIPSVDGLKIYLDRDETDEFERDDGTVARRLMTLSIVPEYGGEFSLPELKVNWFNTDTDKTEIASIPAQYLNVIGAPKTQESITPDKKTPAKSKPKATKNEPSLLKWWPLICVFILGGVAMWIWQKRKRKELLKNADKKITQGIKQAIEHALQTHNRKKLYAALLSWKNTGVTFSNEFAEIYRQIEKSVYQSEQSVDFNKIRHLIRNEEQRQKRHQQKSSKTTLPSLYH